MGADVTTSAQLVGIAKAIPDVETFVTPVFSVNTGARVAQIADAGKIGAFEPVALGPEYRTLGCRLNVALGDAVVYGFEASRDEFVIGSGKYFLGALERVVSQTNRRTPTLGAVERFLASADAVSSASLGQSFILRARATALAPASGYGDRLTAQRTYVEPPSELLYPKLARTPEAYEELERELNGLVQRIRHKKRALD